MGVGGVGVGGLAMRLCVKKALRKECDKVTGEQTQSKLLKKCVCVRKCVVDFQPIARGAGCGATGRAQHAWPMCASHTKS